MDDSRLGTESIADNSLKEICNNEIDATDSGMTTGIMFASNRFGVLSGAKISGNKLYGVDEEGIAFDGFGNDEDLCPTICIGSLSSVTNDTDGRIKIGFGNMAQKLGGIVIGMTISERDDWGKFRLSFNYGTGADGLIARIHSFDDLTNTMKLDLFVNASTINISGVFAVQAGFYNCEISHNEIFGSYGADHTYGIGISLWLNCCGFSVRNNNISGMPRGINVAGGLMLSLYETIAWHNEIAGNNIMGSYNEDAIMVRGVYGSRSYQYGNKVHDNYLQAGNIVMQKQRDFIFRNNRSRNGVAKFTP
jgi:hypothetical protein